VIRTRTREVGYDPDEVVRKRSGCGCHEPKVARARAQQVAETHRVEPHRVPGTEPIVLAGGPDSKCRPFLTVNKDAARFAACNALADEIGPLQDPKKAFRLIGDAIGDEVNEVFGLVTLDLHLRMKSVAETGRGEPSAVAAPMVPTLQAALIDGAHAVIIFHVHPSGVEAKPSQADKDTTKAFVRAFETVNVHFMDHIIVGGDIKKRSYYSFAEDGAL
jgi:DNA repair protein RadC